MCFFFQIEYRVTSIDTVSGRVPGVNIQMMSPDDGGHWTVPTLVDLGRYWDVRPGPGTGMQFSETSRWPGRIAFIGYYGFYKVTLNNNGRACRVKKLRNHTSNTCGSICAQLATSFFMLSLNSCLMAFPIGFEPKLEIWFLLLVKALHNVYIY